MTSGGKKKTISKDQIWGPILELKIQGPNSGSKFGSIFQGSNLWVQLLGPKKGPTQKTKKKQLRGPKRKKTKKDQKKRPKKKTKKNTKEKTKKKKTKKQTKKKTKQKDQFWVQKTNFRVQSPILGVQFFGGKPKAQSKKTNCSEAGKKPNQEVGRIFWAKP